MRRFKPLVFLLLLAPLAWMAWAIPNGALTADPVKGLTHETGIWGLRLLLATLAITPLRRVSGWVWLTRYRRMLGLFAFFYISLHFSVYVFLDLGQRWSELGTDIAKRPYITVGFLAWLLLAPLAVTSTQAMMRRLGRNWQRLHRLVYVAAPLGVLHFFWQVKADEREPLIYAAILLALLLLRLPPVSRRLQRWRRALA